MSQASRRYRVESGIDAFRCCLEGFSVSKQAASGRRSAATKLGPRATAKVLPTNRPTAGFSQRNRFALSALREGSAHGSNRRHDGARDLDERARDFRAAEDANVHRHGTSSIKFGRGAVLTVDLTNRCNMMCNPCFMDANQVGYVHEPTFEDTKAILDRAVSFKPRRQVIILFSGGEPTLSPYYLEAVAYAKKVGFYRILAATNGIRFAEDIEFCKAAKAAGQHGVYLQFDGVGEEKNKHRGVGNLFDVKQQAIENLASVGIKVTLVVTIVNSINNDAIGQIVEFAAKNIDKVQTIAFQPVSFTGRDEDISDELRKKWRYTLAGMTHDLKDQLDGRLQPLRDWFPLSSYSAFTSVMDMLQGADAPWGWSSCNCHPNCGIFALAVVNRKTGEFRSLFEFFNYEQFMKDVAIITDTARGKKLSYAQLGMAIMRNFDAGRAPEGFPISQIINLFKPSSTNSNSDRNDRIFQRSLARVVY